MSNAFTQTPRDARAYRCANCGTETIVSGGDFYQLCNPYSMTLGTMCCGCGIVGLGSVAWVETGEPVSDYRARLRKLPPAWVRFMPLWLILPLGLVGFIGGLLSISGLRAQEAQVLIGIYTAFGAAAGLAFGWVFKSMLSGSLAGVKIWAHVD